MLEGGREAFRILLGGCSDSKRPLTHWHWGCRWSASGHGLTDNRAVTIETKRKRRRKCAVKRKRRGLQLLLVTCNSFLSLSSHSFLPAPTPPKSIQRPKCQVRAPEFVSLSGRLGPSLPLPLEVRSMDGWVGPAASELCLALTRGPIISWWKKIMRKKKTVGQGRKKKT